MNEGLKAIPFALAALLGLSIFSSSFMPARAAEPPANSTADRQTDDKPPERKRIVLDDGLVLNEYREFRSGKVAVLIKTYERNGETIMRQISMPGENDTRTFFRDGKEILGEEIDDKGQIIRIVVSRDDGSWYELFEQQDDGAVAPVGTIKLQQVRKFTEFMNKNFTPFVEAVKDGDKEDADRRLDSMLEKIKAGEIDSRDDDGASKTVE